MTGSMLQTPKGTRDFPPEEMKKLQAVLDTARSVFEKYGFEPLETPAFEDYALLSRKSGEAIKDEIYHFKDKAGRELGLRFDLTVPAARFVAANPGLQKPFKRYQTGRVWRYDNPQAGRYREFWQADADIFGSSSVAADAECLQCFCEVMKSLGFRDFYVRVSNRKVSEALLLSAGVAKEKILDVFRIIDKLDKVGIEGVKKELGEKKLYSEKLIGNLQINDLDKAERIVASVEMGAQGINELKWLMNLAKTLGIGKYIKIDFSLVRGLEYYTGLVFELFAGGRLSCGGGGRYDKLVEQVGGRPTPATGISFGLDRVIELMGQKKLFREYGLKRVFVVSVSDSTRTMIVKITDSLRKAGINAEADLMERDMKKQLEYADKRGIAYAIIVGEKEMKSGKFVLKDMKTGKQKEMSLGNIIKELS